MRCGPYHFDVHESAIIEQDTPVEKKNNKQPTNSQMGRIVDKVLRLHFDHQEPGYSKAMATPATGTSSGTYIPHNREKEDETRSQASTLDLAWAGAGPAEDS